jgi:DNA-binding transcriptional LysR family regulator
VISSLVSGGLGVALMRQDLAEAASDTIAIWGDTRIATQLAFVYRRERERDPPIHALREVVAEVWNVRETTPG